MYKHLVLGIAISTAACVAQDAAPGPAASDPAAPAEPSASAEPITGSLDGRELVRLDVGPGHWIEIHEPAPGVVGMIELFEDGRLEAPLLAAHPDVGGVFAAVRPGAAMPEPLRAALRRAAAAPSTDAPGALARGTGGGKLAPVRGTGAQLVNNHFCDVNGDMAAYVTRWTICRVNHMNGFYAWDGGARTIHGIIYNDNSSQSMLARVQVNASIFDRSMPNGANAYFTFASSTAGMRRLDVLNAENELFHVSTQFYTNALNLGWW